MLEASEGAGRRGGTVSVGRPARRAGLPALWSQVVVGVLLFGLYVAVDLLESPERRTAALQHAHDILALETTLHIDVERALNGWLAPHQVLTTLANYEYAWTYLLSAVAALVWVWVRRPDLWRSTRDSFVVLNLVAFATFWLYPTAPPRMLTSLYVDTVSRGQTIGSWGTGAVDTANQLAAMPSLHVAWALWVSVVLARITARRSVQLLSAFHVLLTVYVVMATANHFLLDAVAAAVPVAAGTWFAAWRHGASVTGEVVPACDAFFLHVEATGAAQQVGGIAVFPPATSAPPPTYDEIRELVDQELVPRGRFHQRLAPPHRWRRRRWVDSEVDLDWHVTERTAPDTPVGFRAVVGELAEQPLPRDRPLWRVVLVREASQGRAAVVLLVHHTMADGMGTVAHALNLFRPRVVLPEVEAAGPGRARRAVATAVGLAQLATDGGAKRLTGSPHRRFGTASLDLEAVRAAARRHGARVTDLLLALVADAVQARHPELADRTGGRLRVSVTVPTQAPGGAEGNATAAVMVDIPLVESSFPDRLADTAARTAPLRRPTRAVGSRFVMTTVLRLLPEPAVRWFAGTVYSGRFFHAIVSNLPGPADPKTMVGRVTEQVLPVLPLAPNAPLALGALSWDGRLELGLTTDPALIDADAVAAHMTAQMAATAAAPVSAEGSLGGRDRPGEGEEQSRTAAR